MDQNTISSNSARVLQVVKITSLEARVLSKHLCKGESSEYFRLSEPDMNSLA